MVENPLPNKIESKIKPKTKKIKKHEHKKGVEKDRKDNPKNKLIKEEKNFFALLIANMVNLRKEKSKNVKSVRDKNFQSKNKKTKKQIKKLNIKNEKTNIKKTDSIKFEIVKNKNKTVKTDVQKIALNNIKSNGKNNLKNIRNKLEERASFKTETDKIKTQKQKTEAKKIKIDVSKIENIKVDSQNREIKIDLIKNGDIKQSDKKGAASKSTMIDEIVNLVKTGDSSGNKIFRIHLEPPELGKVYIQLSFSTDKKLEMKIYVQKTDVQHYIASGMEHLKTSVENLGFKFDNPIIQTMSEFNAGTNQKEGKNEKPKKLRFKVLSSTPFKDNELREEYLQVMDYLQGRVDIRV